MINSQWSPRPSPMQLLEEMFIADIAYVADHPNIPRTLLRAIGQRRKSAFKVMIEAFIQRYERHLPYVIEEAQRCGEIRGSLDKESAARMFIATIQNLVSRSLIADKIGAIREGASDAFITYRICVEVTR